MSDLSIVQYVLKTYVPKVDPLTHDQRRVMDMLVEGRNHREISRVMEIHQKTVSSYRSRIIERMGREAFDKEIAEGRA